MKVEIGNAVNFWTANSKKITLTILFLISVIIDKVFLNDVVYGKDLFESKVFQAVGVSIVIILTHDLQSILNTFIKNKVGIKE